MVKEEFKTSTGTESSAASYIDADMVSTHYLSPSPHHSDHIRADSLRDSSSCSSGASTGAYTTPELDPYNAVCLNETVPKLLV